MRSHFLEEAQVGMIYELLTEDGDGGGHFGLICHAINGCEDGASIRILNQHQNINAAKQEMA